MSPHAKRRNHIAEQRTADHPGHRDPSPGGDRRAHAVSSSSLRAQRSNPESFGGGDSGLLRCARNDDVDRAVSEDLSFRRGRLHASFLPCADVPVVRLKRDRDIQEFLDSVPVDGKSTR